MIEGPGGTSRWVRRHVVRIVSEHQQGCWLVRCIVVQGLVLDHWIWNVLQLDIVKKIVLSVVSKESSKSRCRCEEGAKM
jgi:hypothetical protein